MRGMVARKLKHYASVIQNPQFRNTYFKYFKIISVSFALMLVLAYVTVFIFSQNMLNRELDTANARSLEKSYAVMETLIEQGRTALMRYTSNIDVNLFIGTLRDVYTNYYNYERQWRIITNMNHTVRRNLDTSIVMYGELNSDILSTYSGGQRLSQYTDADIVDQYKKLDKSERLRTLVLRKISITEKAGPQSKRDWVITLYQPLKTQLTNHDFIAVNISCEALAELMGNAEQSEIMVCNKNGEILLDTSLNDISFNIKDVMDTETALKVSSHTSGKFSASKSGRNVRVSWKKAMNSGLTYIHIVPLDAYSINMRNLTSFFGISAVLTIIVALLISLVISMRLFKPIASVSAILNAPYADTEADSVDADARMMLVDMLKAWQSGTQLERDVLDKFASLRRARMQVLRDQMKPHFLYNALQAINWMIIMETGDDQSVSSQAVVTLSEIARTCMDDNRDEAPLFEELDYIKNYISLQRLRYGNELRCDILAPDELMNMMCPRMALHPLVENAISHGAANRMRDSAKTGSRIEGIVVIRITRIGDRAEIAVEDNGLGLSDGEILNLERRINSEHIHLDENGREGIGLANTARRLKLLYGADYVIRISHSELGGIKVKFEVPIVK